MHVVGPGLAGKDITDLLGKLIHGHDGIVTVGTGHQDHRAVGGTAVTAVRAVLALVLIFFVILIFFLHEADQEGSLCDHDGAFHQHAGGLKQDVCRGILLSVDLKLDLRVVVLLALALHHLLESLQVIGEVLHLAGVFHRVRFSFL